MALGSVSQAKGITFYGSVTSVARILCVRDESLSATICSGSLYLWASRLGNQ